MNKLKLLIKNTALFSIVRLSTTLVSFLLMPIYTNHLTPEQYGSAELIMNLSALIVPVITLGMIDSVLRFSMDKEHDNKEILNTVLGVFLVGVILLIIGIHLWEIISLNTLEFRKLTIYLIVLSGLSQIISYYSNGVNKTKEYAISGIISSFVNFLVAFLLIVFLKLNVSGVIYSIIIGRFSVIIYLSYKTSLYRELNYKFFNIKILKILLLYSIPLLFNSLSWNIINYGGRYIINLFTGTAAVGLYSAAAKIPSLISLLYSVFSQAWQISAIKEFESTNKEQFFTEMYKYLMVLMFLGASVVLIISRPLINIYYGPDFNDAYFYIPFLLIGTIFNCLSGFLGSIYMSAKKTKSILVSTLLSALINLLLNIILVPRFEIQGATISSMLCFMTLWIYRLFDSRRILVINPAWKKTIVNIILLFSNVFIYLYSKNYYIIYMLFITIYMMFFNRKEVIKIILAIVKLFRRKNNERLF